MILVKMPMCFMTRQKILFNNLNTHFFGVVMITNGINFLLGDHKHSK